MSETPEEMTVGQTAPDTLVLTFQPTSWQVGNHSVWVLGQTNSVRDSIALEFSVLREPPATSPLCPLALGNRWIYQSVHNRGDFDTVTVTQWDTDHGRGYWEGTFYPTLPVLSGGVAVTDSTISTRDRGLQFRMPQVFRDSFFVESRGLCYSQDLPRIVQKLNGSMTVPAGTFTDVLMFTTMYSVDCANGEREVVAEEIYLALGVRIIKSAQIRSSHCQSGCSSRWELYSYRLNGSANSPLRP